MEKPSEGYHISFFKPTTERARANRNMVLWLVTVWFVAIFGFQILLKILEKPVPEPSYTAYESAWTQIQNGQGTDQQLKDLAKSCLNVSGKIDLAPGEKRTIDHAFSWCVYQLVPATEQQMLIRQIGEFQALSATVSSISDEEYVAQKNALSDQLTQVLSLSADDVRRTLIPFSLQAEGIEALDDETIAMLPGVMSKYLVHNRSALTDARFLGFPFHYFYTAVFLLILFVGLCLIYCVRTDAMNKKLDMAD